MDDLSKLTDRDWQERLSPEAYRVTRRGGTERPFTNDNFPKAPGRFDCVCCGTELFRSEDKFDSGTGWPSFLRPARPEAMQEREDRSMFMRRTEVLCSVCDAHLGHVFPDGPRPTGLRYCINGVALTFQSDSEIS